MNDWLAATEETEPLTKKYQDELIPYDATSKQSSRSIFQFFSIASFETSRYWWNRGSGISVLVHSSN